MADIGDPAVALMMDGRLIGAARLQIAVPDQLHVGSFGRRPDLLALGMCPAAEQEQGCEAGCRFDVTVHVFPPRLSKRPICAGSPITSTAFYRRQNILLTCNHLVAYYRSWKWT